MFIRILYTSISLLIFVHSAPSPYFTRSFVKTPSSSYEQYLVVPDKSDAYRVPVSQVHHFSDFQFPSQQVVYYNPNVESSHHALHTLRKDSPIWQQMLLNMHSKSDENSLMSDEMDEMNMNDGKSASGDDMKENQSAEMDNHNKFMDADAMKMIFSEENINMEMMEKLKRDDSKISQESTTLTPKLLMQPIVVISEEMTDYKKETNLNSEDILLNDENQKDLKIIIDNKEEISQSQKLTDMELMNKMEKEMPNFPEISIPTDNSPVMKNNGRNQMTQATMSEPSNDQFREGIFDENPTIVSEELVVNSSAPNLANNENDFKNSPMIKNDEEIPLIMQKLNLEPSENLANELITNRDSNGDIEQNQQENFESRISLELEDIQSENTEEIIEDNKNQPEIMRKIIEMTTQDDINLFRVNLTALNEENNLMTKPEESQTEETVKVISDQTTEISLMSVDQSKIDRILGLLEDMMTKESQSTTTEKILDINNRITAENIETEMENSSRSALVMQPAKLQDRLLTDLNENQLTSTESSTEGDKIQTTAVTIPEELMETVRSLATNISRIDCIMKILNSSEDEQNKNIENESTAEPIINQNMIEIMRRILEMENMRTSSILPETTTSENLDLIGVETTENSNNFTLEENSTTLNEFIESVQESSTESIEFNVRNLLESSQNTSESVKTSTLLNLETVPNLIELKSEEMTTQSSDTSTSVNDISQSKEEQIIGNIDEPRVEISDSDLTSNEQTRLEFTDTMQTSTQLPQINLSDVTQITEESNNDENKEVVGTDINEENIEMSKINEMIIDRFDEGMENVKSAKQEIKDLNEEFEELIENLSDSKESIEVTEQQNQEPTTEKIQMTQKPQIFGERIIPKINSGENNLDSSQKTLINENASESSEQSTENQSKKQDEQITIQTTETAQNDGNMREGRVNKSPTLFLHNNRFYVISGAPEFYANFDAYQNPRTPIFSLQELQPIRPMSNVAVQNIEPFRVVYADDSVEQKPSTQNDNEPLKMQNNTVDSIRIDIENEKALNVEQKENENMTVKVKKREHDRQPVSEEKRSHDYHKKGEIAQANPDALSISGAGGIASAGPKGTALTGKRGISLASPKGTTFAGNIKLGDSSEEVDYDDTKTSNRQRVQIFKRKVLKGRRNW